MSKLNGSNLGDMLQDQDDDIRQMSTAPNTWQDETAQRSPKPSGVKFDAEKPRYELVPWESMDEIVKALSYGAKKYDDHNWRQVEPVDRYEGAAFRHLSKWAQGERYDEDSGLSHLAHAGACVLFLLAREEEIHGEQESS